MAGKTFRSTTNKRAIDTGKVSVVVAEDLVKIWRSVEGDEKSISLSDLAVGVKSGVETITGTGVNNTDPSNPVIDLTGLIGVGIKLNDQVIGGVKKLIEVIDILVIPLHWEYNIQGVSLDIDGIINNNGEINIG